MDRNWGELTASEGLTAVLRERGAVVTSCWATEMNSLLSKLVLNVEGNELC